MKDGITVLREKLQGEIENHSQFLADGGAKDFAEYQKMVGVIQGLHVALQHLSDLVRNLKGHEDD